MASSSMFIDFSVIFRYSKSYDTKAYQYRLYPNQAQENLIWKHVNHNRGLYNHLLALCIRYYRMHNKSLSKRRLQDHIVKLKKLEKYAWLNEVNSQSLLATNEHLNGAYQRFFKGLARFPRFKSKRSNWHSYANPQYVQVAKGHIKLPKIGWIKAKVHRDFEGKIKTCTVNLPTGKFTISVLVEDGREAPIPRPLTQIVAWVLMWALSHFWSLVMAP